MAGLRNFIEHAEAEARWEFNCLPSRRKQLLATSDNLRSIRPRDPEDEFPALQDRQAVSPVTPVLYDGWPSVVPVSLELPRFADKDFMQSVVVATQAYPESPESRTSTVPDRMIVSFWSCLTRRTE